MKATCIPKIRSHKRCQQKSHGTYTYPPTHTNSLYLCVCGLDLLPLSRLLIHNLSGSYLPYIHTL